MSSIIKVIVVEPNKEAYTKKILNTTANIMKIVKGPLETVGLENGVLLICNKYGKADMLPFCRRIRSKIIVGKDIDFVCGPFIICSFNIINGDLLSLNKEMIEKYIKIYGQAEKLKGFIMAK